MPSSGVPQVGGKYQTLIDANPYRNREYRVSPWQQFWQALGFRTQADAWQENMATQAAEYDAAIMQKQYDEQYNSPQEQVARMRAAGLNPDIDGGSSIDSGQAVALPEDPSTPMQSSGWDGTPESLAHGVLGAFSSALGIVSTFQGIQGKHLSNVLQSINNEDAFAKFASGLSGVLLPDSPNSEGIENFDWKAAALKNAEVFAGKNLPKKMRQKFIDFQEQYWNSAIGEGESYEDFKNRVQSRRDYAMEYQTNYSEINHVLLKIVEPLADMNEKIYRQNQKTTLAQGEAAEAGAQTEEAYQNELSGSSMAAAQNAANQNAAEQQGTLSIVNGTIHEITQALKSSSKKGGLEGALSSIALALISGMYLYTQSGIHPSISRSEGSNSGYFESDRGHGASQGSRSGFSIGF